MKKVFASLLLSLSFILPATAQEATHNTTLADLEWLGGHWVYQRDDGITVEVNWAPAIGNSMVGTLQQRVGEDLMAFENLKLSETSEGISYTFDLFLRDEQFERPYSSNLKLVWMAPNKAQFEGEFFEDGSIITLNLELTPMGQLYSWFVFKGEEDMLAFIRYRADPVNAEPEPELETEPELEDEDEPEDETP